MAEPAEAGIAEVPAEAESSGSPWTEEWDEDEAETPHAWGEPEEEADDGSAPIRDYLTGVLAFGGAEPAVEAETAPAEGVAPETGTPESAPDDDDDLEMFRSWLESLKQ